MRATLVARVLRRTVLASLVSPTLVACGGASSPEGSGTSAGAGGGSSGAGSGGSLAATGAATGASTTGTVTTGSGQSGSVTSGTAQTGANSGVVSGASSGSVSSGTSSGAASGMSASGASDAGASTGRGQDAGTCAILPAQVAGCVSDFDLTGPSTGCSPDDAGALTPAECSALCGASTVAPNGHPVTLMASSCTVSDGDASRGKLHCIYPCPV